MLYVWFIAMTNLFTQGCWWDINVLHIHGVFLFMFIAQIFNYLGKTQLRITISMCDVFHWRQVLCELPIVILGLIF